MYTIYSSTKLNIAKADWNLNTNHTERYFSQSSPNSEELQKEYAFLEKGITEAANSLMSINILWSPRKFLPAW